jgi:hypothetical protein
MRTATLARGADAVCVFVNDRLDAALLQTIHAGGTRLVTLRSTGYDNVDLAAAEKLGMTVLRVPAYSPHAVAEHAIALILALNRKTHLAHARVYKQNFTLEGLVGFDLFSKTVGVVARSAHEAYLRAFFSRVNLRAYDNALALRSALKRNEVEIAFGDGVAFALWLNGSDAAGCCAFRGGPYTESRYFGEGVGIALRRDNQVMKRALDYALKRVAERGVYADLYLKYFPVGFY